MKEKESNPQQNDNSTFSHLNESNIPSTKHIAKNFKSYESEDEQEMPIQDEQIDMVKSQIEQIYVLSEEKVPQKPP